MIKKYAITGGPCSGLTTTITYLKGIGYSTIPEAARRVIEEEQAKGGTLLPWVNRDGFQKRVLQLQLNYLSSLENGVKEVFCDRGVVDGIAFYKLDGLTIPNFMIEIAKTHRYDQVFFLEQLPNFINDSARREDVETGRKISQLIKTTYEEFDYNLVIVPVMSIADRVGFIRKHL